MCTVESVIYGLQTHAHETGNHLAPTTLYIPSTYISVNVPAFRSRSIRGYISYCKCTRVWNGFYTRVHITQIIPPRLEGFLYAGTYHTVNVPAFRRVSIRGYISYCKCTRV